MRFLLSPTEMDTSSECLGDQWWLVILSNMASSTKLATNDGINHHFV